METETLFLPKTKSQELEVGDETFKQPALLFLGMSQSHLHDVIFLLMGDSS